MVWRQNRRYYCYRKKKIKKRTIFAFIVLLLFFALRTMNHWLEPQLQAAARQQTSVALNNIVSRIISEMEYDSDKLIDVERDKEGYITSINYDTNALNTLLHDTLETIDESLEAASHGETDPTLDQTLYENGVIYQLPLGYLTRLPFFNNAGPKIDLRFRMMNDVSGSFEMECEPYGVNNTVIQVNLMITLKAEVLTVLNITEYEHCIELPIVVEIVNGHVPDYYMSRSLVSE